ncbi:MAG: hypothetical protein GX256_03735 [Fretibacterium sp.]|nr:hypothetical protein [Fretibacterium sp.]
MKVCLEILRLVRLLSGLFLYAVGIVLTLRAGLGIQPWDVFHHGVSLKTGLAMGQSNIVVATVIVGLTAAMRESIGLGTLSNMIFIGVFMDFLLESGWFPLSGSLLSGLLMLLGGLFVMAFASVAYIGCGYGAGPRDALMVILARRTGYSSGVCRGALEVAVCLTGWVMGGDAGVGTVIAAFGMGFAVQIVFGLMRFNPTLIRQETVGETLRRWVKPKGKGGGGEGEESDGM